MVESTMSTANKLRFAALRRVSTEKQEKVGESQRNGHPLRAVGYCRTSGEGQRDNTSIPRQQQTIEEFVSRSGWKFLTHYVDECKSGAKEEGREAFQQMIRDAA